MISLSSENRLLKKYIQDIKSSSISLKKVAMCDNSNQSVLNDDELVYSKMTQLFDSLDNDTTINNYHHSYSNSISF